ncbi:aminomethyl-transferring glycine dehydrogenase subunit GcvPA [Magnetospira sp. QH-2]|uniref:aminomethyl-transferring glycine dehydrogenase subunit GcvPA n=1 Tax=Magnetospira sp. (strain QH-2) TaxID=1288970 RepID=UPI0003E81683|nr:aminomethyl-transferring glycine dehydrogenase subunit GcvPA [Magnetospira sp. QH-2]CCQ72740.1 putative glycine dehydrogenase [decarboxylating] subunit 1 [Magnetospira sp. QH-2]
MRYLPLNETDRRDMLATVGAASVDDLYVDVPEEARLHAPVDLPHHAGEMAVEQALTEMAGKNLSPSRCPSFLGAGAYRHHIPASLDYLIQRGEFLTSYTPYQPEVSQGTLQYLYEFQTQVAMLTGMEVANASMYDGATSTAEAVLMALRVTRRGKAILSGGLHPHYREVVETHARFYGFEVDAAEPDPLGGEVLVNRIGKDTACVVVQVPSFFGQIRDITALAEACHEAGALLIAVNTEVMSWGVLRGPGEMGADIVAAEGQSLGNGTSFGGPHVGLFATRQKLLRQMPGRLAGQTTDVDGQRGWVLTLNTREQHIRREKATSNICTNSGLCALAFTIHLTLLGEDGFRRLAQTNHANAVSLAGQLCALPWVKVLNDSYFNEFTLRLPTDAAPVVEALAEKGILGGVPVSRLLPDAGLDDLLLVAATETTTPAHMESFTQALTEVLS